MHLKDIAPYVLESSTSYIERTLENYFKEHPNEEKVIDIADCYFFGRTTVDRLNAISVQYNYLIVDTSNEFNDRLLKFNYDNLQYRQVQKIPHDYVCTSAPQVANYVKELNAGVIYECVNPGVFPVVLMSQLRRPTEICWYMNSVMTTKYMSYLYKVLFCVKGSFKQDQFYKIMNDETEVLWLHDGFVYPMPKTDPIVFPTSNRPVPWSEVALCEKLFPASIGVVPHMGSKEDIDNPWTQVIYNIVHNLPKTDTGVATVSIQEFLTGE